MTIAELRQQQLEDKINREYETQKRERLISQYELMSSYIGAVYGALPAMEESAKSALILTIEQRHLIIEQRLDSLIARAIGERVEPSQRIKVGTEFYYQHRYSELFAV